MNFRSKTFRLYVDESGDHKCYEIPDPHNKYLTLVGIIMTEEDHDRVLVPRFAELRQIVSGVGADPPPLHREDILRRRGAFVRLLDDDLRHKFDNLALETYEATSYTILAVVIDKCSHVNRQTDPKHCYHYCLECLLDQYLRFLERQNARGDVIAEVRGKDADNLLQAAYRDFLDGDGSASPPSATRRRLTSNKLKFAGKRDKIAGVELADLIARNCRDDVLRQVGLPTQELVGFTRQVSEVIAAKYDNDSDNLGKIYLD